MNLQELGNVALLDELINDFGVGQEDDEVTVNQLAERRGDTAYTTALNFLEAKRAAGEMTRRKVIPFGGGRKVFAYRKVEK